jgi:hypothetical protein
MSRKLFCAVCKKNGRPESEYTSHNAREGNDETGRPLCPILINMVCNRCGNAGHIAARCPDRSCVFCNSPGHTVFYCNNAPRDQIDAFLKQRNQDYEDRRMRNHNGFDNRRTNYNDTRPMFNNSRPTFNDSRPAFNDSRPAFNDSRPAFNDSRPVFNDSRPAFNDSRPAFNDSRPKQESFPSLMGKQEDFPSLIGKQEEFPSLGKQEEFPSLGKAKTTNTQKMNFAGVASIMVEQKPKIETPKYNKKENVEIEEESDEELSSDEYRNRLYDKLMNEYHAKQGGETWDLAYKRIMRIVDKNTLKYEEYLESKNQPSDAYCDDW